MARKFYCYSESLRNPRSQRHSKSFNLTSILSEQPLCIPANTIIAYGCSLSKDWQIIENSPISFNLLLDENEDIFDNTTDNNISDESSTQSNKILN